MCLTIPAQIIKIDEHNKTATVNIKNSEQIVDIQLIKNPKISDYLLIHNQIAIRKLPKNEARAILKLLKIKI